MNNQASRAFAFFLTYFFAFQVGLDARAETVPAEIEDDSSQQIVVVPANERDRLFLFSGRIDAMYSAGLPSNEGFSIPSVRFAATGDVSDRLSYRLAFGETREFSTALLPQILPVDAYIDYDFTKALELSSDSSFRWRLGLFNPSVNPWWTPDLTDLEVPDYLQSYQSLFLSRDIGTEITYNFLPSHLTFTLGAFNGNGIFGLNSNNSRAFNALVSGRIALGRTQLTLGASGYTLAQSTPGGSNFRSNWASDFFANYEILGTGFSVGGDIFAGEFQDNTLTTNPFGFSVNIGAELAEAFKFFGRVEYLNSPPSGFAGQLKHVQLGPILYLDQSLKIFLFYDYLEPGDGSVITSGNLRARLIL